MMMMMTLMTLRLDLMTLMLDLMDSDTGSNGPRNRKMTRGEIIGFDQSVLHIKSNFDNENDFDVLDSEWSCTLESSFEPPADFGAVC